MDREDLMDAMHPVWSTPAVLQAAKAAHFGALIRMTRTARRLTLVQVGKLVGYSASTVSRIETGRCKLTDVTLLRRFADAVGIPPQLFGLTSSTGTSPIGAALPPPALTPTKVRETPWEGDDDAVRRRELLVSLVGVTGTGLLGISAWPTSTTTAAIAQRLLAGGSALVAQPVGVQVLRDRLAATRATFHACQYHELAVTLPDVIATAQASLRETTGQQHDHIAALLADAYSLVANLCTRLHDNALAWVTAERALSAAQISGDVVSIAEAARMTSIAMRRFGHHDTATMLLTTTALKLGADSGDPAPELLATYGSLLCTASYTAAQNGNRSSALELITEAETAATRLGDVQVPSSPFSPTNVAIYQIGVHTALGDAGIALDYARKIDLRSVPTPERQARFCLDTARAWHRFGSPSNCFHALQVADRCAPEELRRSSVRSLVASLVETPGPTPSGLREFAARCGAVA
ncbi:MAG: helix-turn-helix domain-containing protein [Pseudonocardiaceae bacterium]